MKDEEDLRDEAERRRLLEVYDRLQEIDADTARARGAILSGLGFDDAAQAQPTASFSGGGGCASRWRALRRARRLAARRADEPLDPARGAQAGRILGGWDKTTVVVTHARAFLNRVCTDILHFQEKQIKR